MRQNAVPAASGSKFKAGGLAIFLEAPGADEDKQGVPAVGRAGRLLDDMLAQAGLSRDEVLVLNRIRCRPTRNRIQDFPDAVLACDEWTKKELDYYAPSVVVLCGNTSLRAVYGPTASITACRGTYRPTAPDYQYGERVWVPTFHPAAALRNPELKPIIVSDLELARSFL